MLSLTYRPSSFDDVTGQKSVSQLLRMMAIKGVIPNTLLFEGVSGSGKTSCARVVAATLNCYLNNGHACGKCDSCVSIRNGSSISVMEIDAATHGLVADMRKLREQVFYAIPERTRIVILDEAQCLTKDAFNALLKVLEEPPPDVVFILVTTEAVKIPVTILSRCISFRFNKISKADIVSRLEYVCSEENMVNIEKELLERLAEESNGSMREALNSLDRITSVGIFTSSQYNEIAEVSDFGPTFILALIKNDLPLAYKIIDCELANCGDTVAVWRQIVEVIRDAMVIDAGGVVSKQGDALEQRRQLAKILTPSRMFAAMKVLWDLKTKISIEDMRASFNVACVMLAESLSDKDVLISKPKMNGTSNNGHRVSFAEMQTILGSSV